MPSSESPKNRRFMEQADQRRRVVARLLALLTLVSGGYYLVWAFRALNPAYPVIGAIFLTAEICSLALFAVATTGVWRLRFKPETGLAIEHPWTVDVLVPTYGEPIETLRATLEAASRIRWTGALTVYVLDDAGSADVEALAEEWGCRYLSRRQAGVPQRDAKAGNLNFGLAHATGDLVLVLDADQRAFPQILEALAGYMRFERVAFVQSQQSFTVPQEDPFYSNDRVFYEAVQLGLDGGDAAISCGSGVLYRRAALDDIGGFATWNLLEDLTTSYTLHATGWKSFYYPHALSVGLAPTDIWGVYQQRGQWAFDTMRLILWDNPLFKRSLGWFPRVTYLIIGLSYLCAAFVFPFFFLIPIWSYLTGGNVLNRPELEFALVRSAYFVCMTLAMQFLFRFRQPGKQFQMLTGLFPIYARGIVRAFFYPKGRKPEYRPNNRPRQRPVRPRALAVLPQLLVLAGNGLLPFYATVSGRVPGRLIAANIAISTLAIWSLLPVVLAALRHGGASRVVAAESTGLVRPHRLGRTVLVSAWLAVTVGFLWVQQPGFWRSPYLRYEQARQLEAAGQTAEAIAEVGRAVADDPANAGYWSYKGYLELAAGRAPEAERSFRDAEALAPGVPDVQLGLADSLGRQGRQAEVRDRLAGLDASTLTEAQRYRRSEALAAAGDFTGAISDQALIDGLAGVERVSAALAWSMAARDWPLAVSLADRILDTQTTDALRLDTLRQQGVALRALDRREEALAAFEQAPDAENLRTRTELLLQLERFDDAVPRLEELAAMDADVDVLGQLAWALEQSGRPDEAIGVHRRVLAVDDAPDTRVRLAGLLMMRQRHGEARDVLAELPVAAVTPAVERQQAQAALWSGRLEEAERLLGRLVARTAQDTALEADLAARYALAGRADAATRVYRGLVETDRADEPTLLRFVDLLNGEGRVGEALAVLRARTGSEALGLRQWRTAAWAGAWDVAARFLRPWVETHPDDAEAWRALAEAGRQTGDVTGEGLALEAVLRLEPTDLTAVARQAQLFERAGRLEDAAAGYTRVAQAAGAPPEALRTLGYVLERLGRHAEAVEAYEQSWARGAGRDPAVALTIARLHRELGALQRALDWYARFAETTPDPDLRRDALVERAMTAVAAGNGAEARRSLAEAVGTAPMDEGALALAAAAESADGQPGRAVEYLEQLAGLRPLTPDEESWLASQYRLAGNAERALAAWERVRIVRPDDPDVLEAVGDLLAPTNPERSADTLARAWEQRTSPELSLKTARAMASVGRYEEAATFYLWLLDTRAPDGLRVEMARTLLASGDLALAEQLARDAAASGTERGLAADVVLAQALHLQGKVREAAAIADRLPWDAPPDAESASLLASLAFARDEHLRSAELRSLALTRGATTPADEAYWRARSRASRGDFARAAADLTRATAGGAPPRLVDLERRAVSQATGPVATAPLQALGDSNGVSLAQGGTTWRWWPARALPLDLSAGAGRLAQDDRSYARTLGSIATTNALVTPRLGIDAAIGAERYTGGGLGAGTGAGTASGAATITTARAGGRYALRDHTSVFLGVERASLWSTQDRREPRSFTRVLRLEALGPAFAVTRTSAAVDARVAIDGQVQVQLDHGRYQDGNRAVSVYGHYQRTLTNRTGTWTALRPNVYWESFRETSDRYFSPGQFVSVGTMWHTIRTTGPWRLEGEINPKVAWFASRAGLAAHGLLDVSRTVGPLVAGGGAFLTWDQRTGYSSWRVSGQVGVRLAR